MRHDPAQVLRERLEKVEARSIETLDHLRRLSALVRGAQALAEADDRDAALLLVDVAVDLIDRGRGA